MNIVTAAHSDKGVKLDINQDSACLITANTKSGIASIAIVCDGMGGLDGGELASASVMEAFIKWFENDFPLLLEKGFEADEMFEEWYNITVSVNEMIGRYGKSKNQKLGTTLTIMLIYNKKYYIENVGDSRAYEISDNTYLLTKDQTFVMREVERGNITQEEAEVHPKKNVLLQCVGASRNVVPDFLFGDVVDGAVYILCSDGFRHEVSSSELFEIFNPSKMNGFYDIKTALFDTIELVKQRGESDNITAVTLKCDFIK